METKTKYILDAADFNTQKVLNIQRDTIAILKENNRLLSEEEFDRVIADLVRVGVKTRDELLHYRKAAGDELRLRMPIKQWYKIMACFDTLRATSLQSRARLLEEAGYNTTEKVQTLIDRNEGLHSLMESQEWMDGRTTGPMVEPELETETRRLLEAKAEFSKAEFYSVADDFVKIGVRSERALRTYKRLHGDNWRISRGTFTKLAHRLNDFRILQSCYCESTLRDAGYDDYYKVRDLILRDAEKLGRVEIKWEYEREADTTPISDTLPCSYDHVRRAYIATMSKITMN